MELAKIAEGNCSACASSNFSITDGVASTEPRTVQLCSPSAATGGSFGTPSSCDNSLRGPVKPLGLRAKRARVLRWADGNPTRLKQWVEDPKASAYCLRWELRWQHTKTKRGVFLYHLYVVHCVLLETGNSAALSQALDLDQQRSRRHGSRRRSSLHPRASLLDPAVSSCDCFLHFSTTHQ